MQGKENAEKENVGIVKCRDRRMPGNENEKYFLIHCVTSQQSNMSHNNAKYLSTMMTPQSGIVSIISLQ